MKLCRPLRTIRKGILKKNKFWAFVPRTSVLPVSPIDQSAGRAQQSIPCHRAMLIERKRPEHVNNSQQVQKLQISWLIHLAPGRTIRLNEFEKCDYWEIMKLAEELATHCDCTIRLRKESMTPKIVKIQQVQSAINEVVGMWLSKNRHPKNPLFQR